MDFLSKKRGEEWLNYLGKMPFDTIILRLSGEIPIKSEGVRGYWEKKLGKIVNYIIKEEGLDNEAFVARERGRLYVYFKDTIIESHSMFINRLRRIFGFSSLSLGIRCESTLDSIKHAVSKLVSSYLELKSDTKTFAIISKKSLSPLFGTTEVRYDIGKFVKDEFNLGVNLDSPDLPIYIDVREKKSYVYIDQVPCFGGLPYGVQSSLTVLLSGGPDSTLASWFTMRRGSPIIPIFYDFGEAKLRKEAKIRVVNIARGLFKHWTPYGEGKLVIVPFDDVTKLIFEVVDDRKYYYIVLKAMMYHFAVELSKIEETSGFVTGEIIGEHASQTVWNLSILSKSIDFPIFRPLLGFDKMDIFRWLRSVDEDLYNFSSKSIEPCKLITGVKPTTKAKEDVFFIYVKKLKDKLKENINDILGDKEVIEF